MPIAIIQPSAAFKHSITSSIGWVNSMQHARIGYRDRQWLMHNQEWWKRQTTITETSIIIKNLQCIFICRGNKLICDAVLIDVKYASRHCCHFHFDFFLFIFVLFFSVSAFVMKSEHNQFCSFKTDKNYNRIIKVSSWLQISYLIKNRWMIAWCC